MKKQILFHASLFIMLGAVIFSACSSDDELNDLKLLQEQSQQQKVLNEETSEFKNTFVEIVKDESVGTRAASNEFTLTEEQTKILKNKAMNMFKSHNISDSDIDGLNSGTDESFIALAVIFATIVEQPSITPARMKTASENEECFDAVLVAECLLKVFAIHEVLKGCVTKTTLVKILGKYASALGYIAMAVEFADCVGWIDFNEWFDF